MQNVEQLSIKIIKNLEVVQKQCTGLQSDRGKTVLSSKNNEKSMLQILNTKGQKFENRKDDLEKELDSSDEMLITEKDNLVNQLPMQLGDQEDNSKVLEHD